MSRCEDAPNNIACIEYESDNCYFDPDELLCLPLDADSAV